MVSTFTPNRQLELMATGDKTDLWGAELNTAVFTLVDQCLGSTLVIPVAAAPVSLTTTQTQNLILSFTGILTANVTVTLPAIGGFFFMKNGTTGNFTLTIASIGAGTSQILPRGYGSMLMSDGTNISNLVQPVGTFTDIAAAATVDLGTIPNGLANITGSGATITSWGATARTVQSFFLAKFNGANTITASASILTPGSTNITTAAGDVYWVWFQGAGVYRIINAMLASGHALVEASSSYVPVPQTVLSGPKDANGAPSFLPSTSVSLVLTAQGLTTTPLVVTATAGYGATGLINNIVVISTNVSWTCTASNTNYLLYDLTNLVTITSILAPIEQYGGSISTTSGQYSYDITAGQMYVGTGAGTTAVNVVKVGECVAGGTTITTSAAYAYQGYYKVPDTATTAASVATTTITHNVGTMDVAVKLAVKNVTTEWGYTAGQVTSYMMIGPGGVPIATDQYTIADRNTINTLTGGSGNAFQVLRRDNGGQGVITAANWKYTGTVRRNF